MKKICFSNVFNVDSLHAEIVYRKQLIKCCKRHFFVAIVASQTMYEMTVIESMHHVSVGVTVVE